MELKKPKPLSYAETVRFHGHDGPFLALGYRLGRHLVKEFKPKGIMGLRILLRAKIEKPYSCILDGLQCSTLATFGKGNISAVRCRSGCIIVVVQAGRRKLTYRMTPYSWSLCLHQKDLKEAARKVLRAPMGELWCRKM